MTTTALIRGRDARRALPAQLTIAAGRQHTADTILRAWFEGKSEHTIRSYQHDLADFALYLSRALGISPPMRPTAALSVLFKQSSPSAHEILLGFRAHLASVHLSAASINRHMATLRSVTKLGRMLGVTTWSIEVSGVRHERRRDTRGPDVESVRRLLVSMADDTEADTRDTAIVLVLFCCGLRVSELVGMNWHETNFTNGTTWIKGKARRERELIPLPAPVLAALQRYSRHRGTAPGPMFLTRGNRGKARDGRLETRSVLRIIRTRGQRIGLHLWCHALRHTSITQASTIGQQAGIGLDRIRAHSRHSSIATLMLYVDDHDRQSTQRTLADLVADSLTEQGGAR